MYVCRSVSMYEGICMPCLKLVVHDSRFDFSTMDTKLHEYTLKPHCQAKSPGFALIYFFVKCNCQSHLKCTLLLARSASHLWF